MRRKMLLRVRLWLNAFSKMNEKLIVYRCHATHGIFIGTFSGDVFANSQIETIDNSSSSWIFLSLREKGKSDSRLKIELKKRGGEEGLTMAMHHAKRKERRRKRRREGGGEKEGGGAAGTGTGDHRVIIYGVYGGSVNRKGSWRHCALEDSRVWRCQPGKALLFTISPPTYPTDLSSIRLRILLARGRIPWSHHLPPKQWVETAPASQGKLTFTCLR